MNSIFLDNKYTNWYFSIISATKNIQRSGYLEKHHIIPTPCGGDKSDENSVWLTAREHYICHMLLVRMTQGIIKNQLIGYLNNMPGNTSTQYQVSKIIMKFSDLLPYYKNKTIESYSSTQIANLNSILLAKADLYLTR